MSHLRDAYGKNSSNSARSMSNILGVWIQISGFCRGITTNNNTKNPLSPERQNSPQFGVRLPAKPRNAGSIAFFQIAGVFFIKGGIFSRAGCFFSGGVSRAMRLRYPLRGGRVFFFRVAAASVFRAARGGRASVRGAGVFFFEGNTHTATIPARQNPPFAKKFRATERIGYQGTAIFAQPPPPPAGRARAAAERARRRATSSPSDRIRQARLPIAPCPYARPASPVAPRPPIRPERPRTRSTYRVRPTVRARHLPNTQMFSAHNMLIINKHKRNIHLKTAKYIHFAAENPQPPPSFLARPSHPSTGRKTMIIAERS